MTAKTNQTTPWVLLTLLAAMACDSGRSSAGGGLGVPDGGDPHTNGHVGDRFAGGVPYYDAYFVGLDAGGTDLSASADALVIDDAVPETAEDHQDVDVAAPEDAALSGSDVSVSVPDGFTPSDAVFPVDAEAGAVDAELDVPVVQPPSTGGSGGSSGVSDGYCGLRPYRVFAPAKDGPIPVVIATHGLGDTYLNFANTMNVIGWPNAAAAIGALLVVPAHQNPVRPSFVYLKPDNSLDWPNTKAELDSVLDCVLSTIGQKWDIRLDQVLWMGFSEGASFADLAGWGLNGKIKGIAPYAGGVGGKTFPIPNPVRVYYVCGTTDYGFQPISAAFQQWVTAGHPSQNVWVSGVGHTFSQLSSQGPPPSAVLQWLAAD